MQVLIQIQFEQMLLHKFCCSVLWYTMSWVSLFVTASLVKTLASLFMMQQGVFLVCFVRWSFWLLARELKIKITSRLHASKWVQIWIFAKMQNVCHLLYPSTCSYYSPLTLRSYFYRIIRGDLPHKSEQRQVNICESSGERILSVVKIFLWRY